MGGATGGGKQSSIGEEGLAGVTPDQDQRTGVRLGNRQTELQQRTHAVLKRLEANTLPTSDLRAALTHLNRLQQYGGAGGVEARRIKAAAIQSLRRAADATADGLQAKKEHTHEQRRTFYSTTHRQNEKIPDAYADQVGDYFKSIAISEEGE